MWHTNTWALFRPQRHLATGSFDGTLQVWDLEHSDLPVFSAKGHSQLINSIDGVGGFADAGGSNVGPSELYTAGRDGFINVWDVRQKDKPVLQIQHHAKADCWAVSTGMRHIFLCSYC